MLAYASRISFDATLAHPELHVRQCACGCRRDVVCRPSVQHIRRLHLNRHTTLSRNRSSRVGGGDGLHISHRKIDSSRSNNTNSHRSPVISIHSSLNVVCAAIGKKAKENCVCVLFLSRRGPNAKAVKNHSDKWPVAQKDCAPR